MFSNVFSENRTVYEKAWNNIVQPDGPQKTIRRMRLACWITKDTHTHTLRLCNTYCVSTASMVARTLLKVRLPYIARPVVNSLA
jgi:hypothetical protein